MLCTPHSTWTFTPSYGTTNWSEIVEETNIASQSADLQSTIANYEIKGLELEEFI